MFQMMDRCNPKIISSLSLAVAIFALPAVAQLPQPANEQPASPPTSPRNTVPDTGAVPYLPPAAPTTEPERPPAKSPPAQPPAAATPVKPAELPPLSIGGVSIRGLKDLEVIKKIKTAHESKLQTPVQLWDGKTVHRLRRDHLGASIPYYKLLRDARGISEEGGDVGLRFEVDLNHATATMKRLAARVNQKPTAASLDVDENNNVILKGGERVDMATVGSAQRVKVALENQPPQDYVELVVKRQQTNSSLNQYKYLLAEYSTPFDPNLRGRTTNLKMSANLVNGKSVAAGQVFSTNHAIGPRNAANGWREAKMFVSGQIVDGVGAGICQTASTIYNAALLANLPIVERHQHSFRVNYVPASRDATIYWGHKDMRFRNNTSGPIYVQTFVRGNRFHTRLYGVSQVRATVAIESKVLSETNGTRSEAYRIVVTPNGERRELLSRDHYKPKPR